MTKRKIFDEVMEGVAAMKSYREGKITLRTFKMDPAPLPKVDSAHSGHPQEAALFKSRLRSPFAY